MKTIVLTKETAKYTHREWDIVPEKDSPRRFLLKNAGGDVLCMLVFPENATIPAPFLHRIATAPELQDIAEMYRDSMMGTPMERSMVFGMVNEVLTRVQYKLSDEK